MALPGIQIINTTLDLGSSVTADIILHFTPTAGLTNTVTDFEAFIASVPIASFTADAESFSSSDGLDSAPGGKSTIRGSFGGGGNPIIIAFLEAIEQDEFCFIPTISALAIPNEANWYASPNIGGSHTSPFVNTLIPNENEFHGEVTNENASFALEEIRNGVLSINEFFVNTNYNLIKNPVSEQLKIKLNDSSTYSQVTISIYSIFGQQVFIKNIQNPIHEIVLDIQLRSGIYVLNIRDERGYFVDKIIVK